MTRTSRQRLGLLSVVIGLLAVAGWQWQAQHRQIPETLLPQDPAGIRQISLRLGNTATEHYQKRDKHWWRTDASDTRADDGYLATLAAIAAAPVLHWRPASDFDPGKVGLAPPLATLTLDGHVLEFGEMSVTGPQRYVRSEEWMALVPARYTPMASRGEALKVP